jgi:hypothetical protein
MQELLHSRTELGPCLAALHVEACEDDVCERVIPQGSQVAQPLNNRVNLVAVLLHLQPGSNERQKLTSSSTRSGISNQSPWQIH